MGELLTDFYKPEETLMSNKEIHFYDGFLEEIKLINNDYSLKKNIDSDSEDYDDEFEVNSNSITKFQYSNNIDTIVKFDPPLLLVDQNHINSILCIPLIENREYTYEKCFGDIANITNTIEILKIAKSCIAASSNYRQHLTWYGWNGSMFRDINASLKKMEL
jgi:hypothetical protein